MSNKKDLKRKITYRYSESFKQKIVSELEKGESSITALKTKYGIGGNETIQRWIKQFGKNDLLSKKVRIEMPDELSQIKKLQAQISELEQGLIKTQLENLSNQAYLDLACEELGLATEAFKKKQIKKST